MDIFLLSAGDVIDLNGLPSELEDVAYVTVTGEEAIVCRVPRVLLRQVLLARSPGAEVLYDQKQARLAELLDLLMEFVYYDTPGRLSHRLADSAHGDPEHMVWETHEALARRIGVQREVVTRLVKPLKRRGLIEYRTHYHGIKVLDIDALAKAERGQ